MITRTRVIALATIALILTTTACAARLSVTDIRQNEPNTFVDGIPFRIRETQELIVYQRKADGTYEEVYRKYHDLPNMDELYAVNLSGDVFSKHKLTVQMRADSTLHISKLHTELRGDEALKALGTQVEKLSTSVTGFEKKQSDVAAQIEAARLAGVTTELKEEYRRAFVAALDAERDFLMERGGWTEEQVDALKRTANRIAPRAGKSKPFPEVGD